MGSTRHEWLKAELGSEQVRAGVVTDCETRRGPGQQRFGRDEQALEIQEGRVGVWPPCVYEKDIGSFAT